MVADEVRTLARRTQTATVEIQSMIEELQSDTRSLGGIMGETVDQANRGLELVDSIGTDFSNISQRSKAVFGMSAQIAASAEEQSKVADEVAKNLSDIRDQSVQLEGSASDTVMGTQGIAATTNEMK